jgi:acyl carrier protein
LDQNGGSIVNVEVDDILTLMTRELDLDVGDVTPESTADDIEEWDSLGHLALCMAIEARYGIVIPMDQVGELLSVPAIIDYLNRL